MPNTDKLSMLLIDDDSVFCQIMSAAASQLKIHLDYITSPLQIKSFQWHTKYDVILLDFDLGSIDGLTALTEFEQIIGEQPVILVTCKNFSEVSEMKWPKSVVSYICKSEGYQSILQQALHFAQKQAV